MDRRTGKITELIKMAHENWLYIICLDRQRAELISDMAKEMGLDIPFPITLRELPIRNPFIKEVLIDDMEDILQTLVQIPIKYAATSCEIINK